RDIFNHDFTTDTDAGAVLQRFFGKTLTLADLRKVHAFLHAQSVMLEGRAIPAALRIPGSTPGLPLVLLAQVHGNEPAGLAAVLLVLALSQAGLLEREVVAVIGNPLAAAQYFEHLAAHPHARQEVRDAFRCGLDETGRLLPDMNRVPSDFLTRETLTPHITRCRELYALGLHAGGILDIHSARGNMLCITDHRTDMELRASPIRALLLGLAEAIGANASAAVSVETWKPIYHRMPNIKYQVGIEAGRHEAPDSPYNAANFALSFLSATGWTSAPPLKADNSPVFEGYHVQPRITYADLRHDAATLHADDMVYMARPCQALASVPERCDAVVVKRDGHYVLQSVAEFTQKPAGAMEYAIYQYDEMEAIPEGQVVAVAVPSGTAFRTTEAFSGIFFSKSGALYDKDPSVGPWPVAASQLASVKFCYPCRVSPARLEF
ncbi:MAG: hypothetical protein EBX37_13065, partial [Alphaproteobacteria bacterium]|nr:hypothetical protein [Alphaproteobacteria bacterium]